MSDIELRLELWGAWAASYNSGVDWQHIAAGFKILLPECKRNRPQCDDNEGVLIDGCIARLKKNRQDEFEIIISYFVLGLSLRSIAKSRGCSDGTVRKKMQGALGYIDGVISMKSL